jgi:hypothetical protein
MLSYSIIKEKQTLVCNRYTRPWFVLQPILKYLGGIIMGDKNPKPKSENKKKPKEDKVKKEKKKY